MSSPAQSCWCILILAITIVLFMYTPGEGRKIYRDLKPDKLRKINKYSIGITTIITSLHCLILLLCVGLNCAATASDIAANIVYQKVGEARLDVLFWSIYNSRLYTQDGTYTEGELPLRLEIQYLVNIKAEKLLKRTLSEWEDMGRDHPQQEAWIEQLGELWRDIRAGDVLTLELTESNRANFLFNGEHIGGIDDPEFGQHFADIWLSTDSTRPELRLSLVGLAD
jgi:hypothetical protein